MDLLKTNLKTVDITASGPGEHDPQRLPRRRRVPATGIYDREGVTAGTPYTRTYTFTRHDGPGGAITYNVGWIGNDGTFSAPSLDLARQGRLGDAAGDGQPAAVGVPLGGPDLDDPATTGSTTRR